MTEAVFTLAPHPLDAAAPALQARDRRIFDYLVASLTLPLLCVVATLLIGLNAIFNRGPLFYTQTRIGLHGRPFRIYKFRSMRPSQSVRAFDEPLEEERLTPLGRMLRRHKIDELPQIINILRGEMSLIGPRPEAAEHAKVFAARIPNYAWRHVVRPGITGLAQIKYGYAEGLADTAAKVHADLTYIGERSFRLDLIILLHTLKLVCLARGR